MGCSVDTGITITGGVLGIVGAGPIAIRYSSVLVELSEGYTARHFTSCHAISSCSWVAFNDLLMQPMVPVMAASI